MSTRRSVVLAFSAFASIVVPALAVGCGSAPEESTRSESSPLGQMVAVATATAATDEPVEQCNVDSSNSIVVDPAPGCAPFGDWSQGAFCNSGNDPDNLAWGPGFNCLPFSAAYNYCVETHGAPTVANENCVYLYQACGGGHGSISTVAASPCAGGSGVARADSCCTCGSCERQ